MSLQLHIKFIKMQTDICEEGESTESTPIRELMKILQAFLTDDRHNLMAESKDKFQNIATSKPPNFCDTADHSQLLQLRTSV